MENKSCDSYPLPAYIYDLQQRISLREQMEAGRPSLSGGESTKTEEVNWRILCHIASISLSMPLPNEDHPPLAS